MAAVPAAMHLRKTMAAVDIGPGRARRSQIVGSTGGAGIESQST
jgi:hypothetical protein